MKKINLTSDRVRLPSNTASFPTQLNRALTKLKLPFPWLQQSIPTGAAKYSRYSCFGNRKQNNSLIFVENSKKNGWEKGADVEIDRSIKQISGTPH
jgi:hypothetical protein